jgi:hypothetical protein
MEIRSYRRVFELERRLYRIDRLRLNPGGVPVRGLVYLLAILAADLLVGCLPLVGALARAVPWYLRYLALPGVAATVLSAIRLEGRPFHLAFGALIRHRLGPRHLAGISRRRGVAGRWWPAELLVLPDGSDSRMRRLRYTGPGAVLVTVAHARASRAVHARPRTTGALQRPAVTLEELPGARALPKGQIISLAPGGRMLVRPAPARSTL